jgi:hypothetical protein
MSFIKNFGLYWERERIKWGKKGKGNQGSLMGYRATGDEDGVEFRQQAGIYVLYEGKDIATSRPIYVGQVGRRANDSLLGRLKDQAFRSHLWNRWSLFSWFGMFEVGEANTLVHVKIDKSAKLPLPGIIDHLEGALITLLEPPLNKRGANWGGATQYFQDDTNEQGRLLDEVKAMREELAKLTPK